MHFHSPGLGSTVSAIDVTDVPVFPKTKFSMYLPEVKQLLESKHSDVDSFVLFGIEVSMAVIMAICIYSVLCFVFLNRSCGITAAL